MTDEKRVPVYAHLYSYIVYTVDKDTVLRQGTVRDLDTARNIATGGIQKGEYAVVFELVPMYRVDPQAPTVTPL